MSVEKLYQAVKSGKVKMDDLNDEGVKELQSYVRTLRPETYGDSSQSSRSLRTEQQSMKQGSRAPASSIPVTTNYQQDVPTLQQEKIRMMQSDPKKAPAVSIPETKPKQNLLQKAGNVLQTVDNRIDDFVRGGANKITLGVSGKLEKEHGIEPIRDTAARKAGEITGDVLGVAGAYKLAGKAIPLVAKNAPTLKKLGNIGAQGALAGLGYSGAKEGLDAALDTRDNGQETLGQRAMNVGTETAMFAAGDVALGAAGRIGKVIADRTGLTKKTVDAINKLRTQPITKQTAATTQPLVQQKQGVQGMVSRSNNEIKITPNDEFIPRQLKKRQPVSGRFYRGRGVESTGYSGVSQYGEGTYYTNVRKVAEIFAENRGTGAYVEEADVALKRPFVDYELDSATPEYKNLASLLKAEGATDKQVKDILQGDKYPPFQSIANFFRGREQGATMWPGSNKASEVIREAGYDGLIAETRNLPDLPNHLQIVRFPEKKGTPISKVANNPVTKSANDSVDTSALDSEYNSVKSKMEELEDKLDEDGLTDAEDALYGQLKKRLNEIVADTNKLKQPKVNALKASPNQEPQSFTGLYKPFPQRALQTERTISRNQVVKNMRKNLGVVLDTGRLSQGKGVLGIYKIQPEVVRTKQQGDLQVLSHEIGHHLDKKFNLSQQQQFQQELINLTNRVSPNHLANYQPHQHMEESIAEYFRTFLVDPQQARQLAPNFTQFLESVMPKKLQEGLMATQKDIDTWISQGAFEQAKGLLDFDSTPKKKFNFNDWYTHNVDDLNPLKLVEKALKGKLGLGNESIYKMARLSRGVAEKAKMSITRGIYDAQGNKIVDGLAEIIKPLEKMGVSEKDFATYLSVVHSLDLKQLGKKVPFDDNQIKAVMQRMDIPEMQQVQKGIVKWNNALLDILVDAQVLSPSSVMQMRRQYPNYVPFMRYFDDDAIAGFRGGYGSGKGFANLTNPVKRMSDEGSTRTIINPFESMVKNTFLAMNAAAKNKVGLQLDNLSQIDGAGAWVEALEEGGRDSKEHVITVFVNGIAKPLKIREPELHSAMLSLDHETANTIVKFLGGAAGMLRAGATLTPEFIIRNPMRDVVGAIINSSQYGFNPVDFFKGLGHVVGKTETFNQFISSGGAYSTLMALDRSAQREALDEVFRQTFKNKAMHVIKTPSEWLKLLPKLTIGNLRKASEVTELATKVGAFNKVMKKTGSLEEAAYVARDLMDFNRAGSNIRPANRIIAFLNASIQGTDKLGRSFKENKASFLTRAAVTLVAPSVALHYWNNNLPADMQEQFNNIPQWQKDTFFIVGIPGTGEFVRIPKPFEAGVLFATGTDRFLRWMQENDPDAWKNYGMTVMDAFTPPVLITALMPIIEATTNYNFFRKAPIVPLGEQRREKKDQYGLYTSETSKEIAKVLSNTPLKNSNLASPRIIDNTIRGYTAGLGSYAVSGIDEGIKAVRGDRGIPLPGKKLTEQPLARAFFASTAGGGQIREEFYNKWNELDRQKASADFKDQPFVNADYNRFKAAKKNMDAMYDQYRRIQEHKTMSPSEKRKQIDILDKQMNNIARLALQK